MFFSKKKKVGPQFIYSEKEINEIDQFIIEHFGNYPNVIHEIFSPDIHLDICVVEPTESEPFYKLITMGAGAYRMNVPSEYKKYNIEYAEYMICLPATWNLQSSDEKDYWPIRALKDVARLPIMCNTWLCYGHTTQCDEEGSPYAENTKINSLILDEAIKDASSMTMSSGKVVNFWKIVPLYSEELQYKMENGAEELFELMKQKGTYIDALDINRRNTFI